MQFAKVIRDAVHGYIPITDLEKSLIDTVIMQRLRGIKQMGTAYLTFPTAVHTRFDHSLGVMHIADKMIVKILNEFSDGWELNQSEKEEIRELVRVSALLHDIGHGPFSHVSEPIIRDILKKRGVYIPQAKGAHELITLELIKEKILPKFESHPFLQNHPNLFNNVIKALKGEFREDPIELSGAVNKILSSPLDADKLDYLYRDSYFAGLKFGLSVDIDRIIHNLTIFDGKLMFEMKALSSVETVVYSKFEMIRWIYKHHTVCLTNEIMLRALINALEGGILCEDDFHVNGIMKKVDDCYVIHRIKCFKNSSSEREGKSIDVAKKFVDMLENRDLLGPLWIYRAEFDELVKAHKQEDIFNRVVEKRKELEKTFAEEIEVPPEHVIIHHAPEEAYVPPYEFPREEEIYFKTNGGTKKLSDLSPIVNTIMVNYKHLREFFRVYIPKCKRGKTTDQKKVAIDKLIKATDSISL